MVSDHRLDWAAALRAFVEARWRAARLKSRSEVEAYQAKRLGVWLTRDVPAVAYYRSRHVRMLSDLPLVDKSDHMASFGAFNRLGLSAEAGWAHFRAGTAPDGHHVGASTGTSGNRGLYLISAAERARWLGTILAKTLPRFPLESARVAIVLPQESALYRQPGRGRLLALRFFDLNKGHADLPARLSTFHPDTIVAPPKILRFLAEAGALGGLRRCFSGAEVLDPPDRRIIEAHSGLKPGEIYMATEGLLATSCPYGRLHLAEDVVHFEYEPGPEGSGLVAPVISDFSRTTQIMARYRMNDLLRLSRSPCPCGSPFQAVDEVVGRHDDVLLLRSSESVLPVMITPDIVRNTIVRAAPGITDFRCVQDGPASLRVLLPPNSGAAAERAVRDALSALIASRGAAATLDISEAPLPVSSVKLRRVCRQWKGEAE